MRVNEESLSQPLEDAHKSRYRQVEDYAGLDLFHYQVNGRDGTRMVMHTDIQ